ncbi:MAG: acyl transferase [Bacteroidia bacterium]|nr:acyl transferase [Bacteroidia bacterium]
MKSFEQDLYTVNDSTFKDIALGIFIKQAKENKVYADFMRYLRINPKDVDALDKIPFLPVSFFKTHHVITGTQHNPEIVFRSSGTSGSRTSRHIVPHLSFYENNTKLNFEYFFGSLNDYHILALLPSYLERDGSSLISMVNYFIRESQSTEAGFYLHNLEALIKKTQELKGGDRKILVLGVSFALLELAEKFEIDLSHCLVMETGGMKGRRSELTREELHLILQKKFNVRAIHSEYGMTELMSQAYSIANGTFRLPPWMKVLARDLNDPFKLEDIGKTGGINVIDLANLHSCAFIETQDLGKVHQNGCFEVLGRFDNSDIRGCNLLV